MDKSKFCLLKFPLLILNVEQDVLPSACPASFSALTTTCDPDWPVCVMGG